MGFEVVELLCQQRHADTVQEPVGSQSSRLSLQPATVAPPIPMVHCGKVLHGMGPPQSERPRDKQTGTSVGLRFVPVHSTRVFVGKHGINAHPISCRDWFLATALSHAPVGCNQFAINKTTPPRHPNAQSFVSSLSIRMQ